MKLVPFVLTKKESGLFQMTRCTLFLSHAGKSIWQTDESGSISLETLQTDYLGPNGFAVHDIQLDTKRQTAYIQIDPTKTSFEDFYTWEEALQKQDKPECWRHFYFVKDRDGTDWWSPKGLLEAEFQSGEAVSEVFQEIASRFSDT
jgi:hypothetical protein